jgi:transketolase
MAIGEKYLGAKFNKEDCDIINHYTYVLCGDGDLQEGVTQEAMSLAGHMGLSKLIVLYDSNDIQLDGPVNLTNTENVKAKYEAMNWQHILVKDGEDIKAINGAIQMARESKDRPTIIEIKTIIGYGSPKAGSSATHGSPIGHEGAEKAREFFDWALTPFDIPKEIYNDIQSKNKIKGIESFEDWKVKIQKYSDKYPEDSKKLMQIIDKKSADIDFDDIFNQYKPKASMATRASSGDIIKLLQEKIPALIGGSADLTSSTKVKGIDGDFSSENSLGRNINFGVREHAMAAIVNGLTLHGLKGFSGGFFIFSDYMRPAMRMAALMGIPSIYIFTHDSVAVGEDGPTHEPVEQLAGLRAVPNLEVIRPADANEVMTAYKIALTSEKTPTVIVLTRQDVPTLSEVSAEGVEKGGYVISKESGKIDAILIATGSEVALAIEAQKELLKDGIDTRVVSLPSFSRFNSQDKEYKESILPSSITKRVAIEMGSSFGWDQYTGFEGAKITIDKFGASAKGEEVIEKYGFNVNNVINVVKSII